MSAAELLNRHGYSVFVAENRPADKVKNQTQKLEQLGVSYETNCQSSVHLNDTDFIVKSPGVPNTNPFITEAKIKKIPIHSEVEIASWFCKAPVIAITGSNGKSTTTCLTGALIKDHFPQTFIGGNLGIPFSEHADKLTDKDYAVVELSNFQLEDSTIFKPFIAILLNITPDHLDRYPSFSAYIATKFRIIKDQTLDDYFIYNVDDPIVMQNMRAIPSQPLTISLDKNRCSFVYFEKEKLYTKDGDFIINYNDMKLKGIHNKYNILASVTAALCLKIPLYIIQKNLLSFVPIEHRLEYVDTINDVIFYNDSKATNTDATKWALKGFNESIHLLVGGKFKEKDFSAIIPVLKEKKLTFYIFGKSKTFIADQFKDLGHDLYVYEDLESAFKQSCKNAKAGEIVLLSPMCASLDQYNSFEERGRHFKTLVKNIKQQDV